VFAASIAAFACSESSESGAASVETTPIDSTTDQAADRATDTNLAPTDAAAPSRANDGLDLAVLEPLPEHVRARPAVPPGHVVAHGSIGEFAPPAGAVALRFADLAAPNYEAPSPGSTAKRPSLDTVLAPAVLAAHGQRVAITGFATLERSESGHAVALLLTPLPPGCCLGRTPAVDERVHVSLPASLAVIVDPWQPLTLLGQFAAEERTDAFGLFEGLYFLAADECVR
jgi:hypothetical protein